MPSTATAPAKSKPPLSRDEAMSLINSMPFLVAGSDQKLLRSMYTVREYQGLAKHLKAMLEQPVLPVAFEVTSNARTYRFTEQPFRVIRLISWEEYRRILPHGARFKYFYEIHTD